MMMMMMIYGLIIYISEFQFEEYLFLKSVRINNILQFAAIHFRVSSIFHFTLKI
jgi:hypothetical protein